MSNTGGSTQTHLPQPGNPAIDFVAAGCPLPATDQRGVSRPVAGDGVGGTVCDARSVEYGAAISVVYLPLLIKQLDNVRFLDLPRESTKSTKETSSSLRSLCSFVAKLALLK
jgi:hypothetical protein